MEESQDISWHSRNIPVEPPRLKGDDNGYPHDGRADKNPYSHDRRADKDSYPHDSNNQCIILRLQLSLGERSGSMLV